VTRLSVEKAGVLPNGIQYRILSLPDTRSSLRPSRPRALPRTPDLPLTHQAEARTESRTRPKAVRLLLDGRQRSGCVPQSLPFGQRE